MDIETRTIESMQLAAVITRSPHIDFRGAWERLPPVAATLVPRPTQRLAVFEATALDGPASMRFYAACVTVPSGGYNVSTPLESLTVSGGRYAVGMHQGAYDQMPNAWGRFVQALAASSFKLDLARPCLEMYLDDPRSTPVASLRTELCVPIAE